MAKKNMLSTIFLLLIIMQQNFGSIEPSRFQNDENKGGDDAFRPTSPGHSPGVGHQTPPGPQNFYNMYGDDAFRPTNP
jgi:hypothetical protein